MGNPLARLWTDRADIHRNTKVVDSHNITDFQLVPIAFDIPCRVSWNVKVPRTDATIVQRTDMEARLFFPLNTDIQTGDIVYLRRGKKKTEYIFQEISIPMEHTKHLEVNCKEQQKRA